MATGNNDGWCIVMEMEIDRLLRIASRQPDVRPIADGGNDYILCHDFMYRDHTIKRGYLTDLASVPWFLRWVMGRDGLWRAAALLHDHGYIKDHRGHDRLWWDNLFLNVMYEFNVVSWKAKGAYFLVRKFGWLWWRKDI